ncbi:polymer-forming cytoskeletal protein [Herbaspirillum frisingense]|uniref:polymer-forming cytoskeletal protein n=1 Tax=Herbaspirillum frisingense TaxID=92645 RepID=UPI001F486623|nr:polymer-forming cytoskeletal protein [Herbaspirillum frisingense]UIN19850.1 polymer-forming cytoskeletal protein [Herbaspirillum frisingense]
MTSLLRRISQQLLCFPKRSIPPDPQQRHMRRRQRGFALGQALVSTAMLGAVGAVGTDWASQQRQAAVLEAQNAVYARINNGVGAYMTLYYPRIIDRSTFPDSCAKLSFSTPVSTDKSCSFEATYVNAAKVSQTHKVNNILQPTLADLQALGLVDPQIPAAPLLPVHATVATGPAVGSTPATHGNIYGILIKRTPAGTDVNLDSLVFNVQPYALVHADMSALLRMSNGVGASSGLPDRDTTTSSINPQFDLKAYAGAWSATNPVQQQVKDVATGVPGILAWRNGYAAAATLELIRRDGSLKPTADWDFANRSITNLKEIRAQDITSSGTLTATTVTSGNVTTGTLTANGTAKLNSTLDVTGTLTALGRMVVQGATDIQSLVVNGEATFKAPVKMEKSLAVAGELNANGGVRTGNLNVENGAQLSGSGARLLADGNFVTLGKSCAQNLALAQDTTGRLMICAAGSWQTANNNYGLSQVNVGDSCGPDGSAAYLPNGLMAICRSSKWQAAAISNQASGQPCSTQGMMAAEITAQGVANLLVCQASGSGGLTWSTSNIYARSKAEVAREGDSCNTDQINALASNRNGDESGILRCTSNGSGGAQWKLPFKKYTEETIDTNEYLAVDFGWRDHWYHPVQGLWGQTILGQVHLKHWKDGVAINSWENKQEVRGPDNGLYFFRNRDVGGDYPNENFSRARFEFTPPLNPSEWTKPIFRRPNSSCTNCYLDDDGKDGGPNRRVIVFHPNFLEFNFYNPATGSLRGDINYYQFVMFKKKTGRTYLITE